MPTTQTNAEKLTEAYHLVFDVKDEHTAGAFVFQAAADAARAIATVMAALELEAPRRFDGEGRHAATRKHPKVTLLDFAGNEIKVGDELVQVHLDAGVGAALWTSSMTLTAVGFGRSRVKVTGQFNGTTSIGASALHVRKAVDGRHLRTLEDRWAERLDLNEKEPTT